MAVYDLRNSKDYLRVLKDIEMFKENEQKIVVAKFYPVATDKQQRYLHFMISYLALHLGDTFFSTLREIQRHVCCHIFYTDELDKRGHRKYKPLSALNTAEASSVIRNVIDYAGVQGIMIPEPDDKIGLQMCA